ncbi:MAG: hypothetical protein JNM69_24365 [Archangium sp.]|nr:hypothetical protein [Archangium sp.]
MTSNCGAGVAPPTITLGETASLEKVGSTWFFATPFVTSPTANAVDVEYSFRVRQMSGGFLNTELSEAVVYKNPPAKLSIPLDASAQFPESRAVRLKLEAMAISWDGVDMEFAVESREYRFTR